MKITVEIDQPRWMRRQPASVRRAIAVGCAFAVLGLPAAAVASHSFPDVLDSHTFHTDIGVVKDLGIAGGFGDGTYRPGDPVNRGAMARFLTRTARLDGLSFTEEVLLGGATINNTGYIPIGAHDITAHTGCYLALDSTVTWESPVDDIALMLRYYVDGSPVGQVFSDSDAAAGQHVSTTGAMAFPYVEPGDHSIELRAAINNSLNGRHAYINKVASMAQCHPFDAQGTLFSTSS